MSFNVIDVVTPGLSTIIELTSEIIKRSREGEKQARAEKESFLQKLENSTGEDVFKYMNLISFASMDEFVAAARLHAQQSFKICLFSAVTGFLIILISIGFGIYFQIAGTNGMSAAYLGAAVGLVSEAISAIFFSLYAKTISQVNRFHDRLLGSQSAYSAMLSTSLINDDVERQKHIIALSSKMMLRLESLDKGVVQK